MNHWHRMVILIYYLSGWYKNFLTNPPHLNNVGLRPADPWHLDQVWQLVGYLFGGTSCGVFGLVTWYGMLSLSQ